MTPHDLGTEPVRVRRSIPGSSGPPRPDRLREQPVGPPRVLTCQDRPIRTMRSEFGQTYWSSLVGGAAGASSTVTAMP
jgi:hypothetical protein